MKSINFIFPLGNTLDSRVYIEALYDSISL